ncbi:MAG: hypothetical protein H8E55_66740 [Pelagibacterales bacterium]|nr:hypothetical protein [Pelagibacterales bacterium]
MADKLDLTILPIKEDGTEKKLKKPIHPNLPNIAQGEFGILIAPVKCGKSTILSNLLLNPNLYKDQFDIVYIISNTIHNDRTSRFLKKAFPDTIFSEYKDSIIDNIVKYQESFPKDKQPFIAVILDDFLGIKKGAAINNFISRFRHYNVGLVLMASQLFRGLPPIARQNATFCCIGGPNPNEKEVDKICEEYGDMYGGQENFKALYKHCTAQPYNFLYCPLQSNPSRAYKNFTEKIYEGKNLINVNKYKEEEADSESESEVFEA